MNEIVLSVFSTLTFLSVIMLISGVILLILVALFKKNRILKMMQKFIGENAVPLAFLVAVGATLGSLLFSEILGFVPCKLCWFQRIFMYPQVVILGVALLINDTKARVYAVILSIMGLLIALYHILVQTFPGAFQCSDETANCALVQFKYFGFVTVPVMGAVAFLLIILLMVFSFKTKVK